MREERQRGGEERNREREKEAEAKK